VRSLRGRPQGTAGLLTPGIARRARWKASRLRTRIGGMVVSFRFVPGMVGPQPDCYKARQPGAP
jgi:hypothetical protein